MDCNSDVNYDTNSYSNTVSDDEEQLTYNFNKMSLNHNYQSIFSVPKQLEQPFPISLEYRLYQLLSNLGGDLIFTCLNIFILSSIIGYSSKALVKPNHRFTNIEILLMSVTIIGFIKFTANIEQLSPLWINMANVNTYYPIFSQVSSSIYSFFNQSIILLFIISLINKLTNYGRTRHYIYVLVIMAFITAVTGMELGSGASITTINHWLYIALLRSLIVLVLYKFYLTHDTTIIPMIVAIMIATELIINATTNGYPSIILVNVVTIIIVMLLGHYSRINLLKLSE